MAVPEDAYALGASYLRSVRPAALLPATCILHERAAISRATCNLGKLFSLPVECRRIDSENARGFFQGCAIGDHPLDMCRLNLLERDLSADPNFLRIPVERLAKIIHFNLWAGT